MRPRRAAARLLVLACVALPLVAGCGKKGPPLAPLARLPVAPPQASASRADDVVTIRFTVPAANVSGVRPADIERIDVYAWTGPDVPPARVFKLAQVVASVPVRPPPPSQEENAEGTAPPPPPPVGPGVDQGAVTELSETLSAEAFAPIDVTDPRKKPAAVHEPKVTPPDAVPVPAPLTRRYVVVGVNHGGRRGPAAPVAAVPLWPAPPAPVGVKAIPRETGTDVTWTAPAHLREPVMANALPPAPRAPAAPPPAAGQQAPAAAQGPVPGQAPAPDRAPVPGQAPGVERPPGAAGQQPTANGEPPPVGELSAAGAKPPTTDSTKLLPAGLAVPWPAVTIGYHVYDVASAGPPGLVPAQAGAPTPAQPRRLTTTPLQLTTFSDTRVEYGVERCYLVRTVETIGAMSVESAWSAPACIKPADVFPPAAPKALAAVSSEGAISLIWEGGDEADLAGYLVLRGTAPGTPVERVTPQPIRETTFRDTTVTPGTRYVYAVIAVDTAVPPNASAPSNQVEETAR